jgi:hypothetical protein
MKLTKPSIFETTVKAGRFDDEGGRCRVEQPAET